MNDMAKIFWNGRSQAVRLPKAYRFDAAEVRISREGDRVILEPAGAVDDDAWAMKFVGAFDEDFARAVEEGRLGPEHLPEGPTLA